MSSQFVNRFFDKLARRSGTPAGAPVGRMVIFLCIVTPVILLVALGYWQTRESLTEMALERRQSLAHLSALTLKSKLDNLTDVGTSLASRVQFRGLIAQGNWDGAIKILERVPTDLPYIERFFLADATGTLKSDIPPLPNMGGENFAHRDWFQGVSREWKPYISGTYKRAAEPRHNVIAAAIPIKGNDGSVFGVLVLQVRVEKLLEWSREISPGTLGFVYFVDHKGRAATHPKFRGEEITDLTAVPAVQRALRGERGVLVALNPLENEEQVSAYESVPGYGWGVVAQQPSREAFAARDEALQHLLIRNGVVLLISAALAVFVVFALEALQRYAANVADLYNNAPCGYHSLDADGTFVRLNDTESRWLGYTREEIVGKRKFRDLLTEESRKTFLERFPQFKKDGEINGVQFDIVRKDGTILRALLNATAVRDADGRFVMSRSTMFDVTELRRAQDALQAVNHELEAFAYSVSHDLRAPLRSIDGFSLALLEDCNDKLDPQGREHLGRVRAATQRMGTLIDDLLNLSRVTRAELRMGRVDLSALANDIVAELRQHEPQRRTETVIANGLKAEGDARLLRLVLQNLLGNAWKFTAKRDAARIEFGFEQSGDGSAFFVRDNGAGFDMNYADKLFGAFQRLHAASEFPGTGVGLATVQRILHRHGGRVWAMSVVNEGATFYFTVS